MKESADKRRVRPLRRIAVLVIVSLASLPLFAPACSPTRTTIEPPYRYAGVDFPTETSLVSEVSTRCPPLADNSVLHPFTTDGCSVWPDGGWRECCLAHDVEYWCGGASMNRRQADRALRSCVAELSGPIHASVMYLGVRIGGYHMWPFGWRWGYGRDWPYRGRTSD